MEYRKSLINKIINIKILTFYTKFLCCDDTIYWKKESSSNNFNF